MKPGRILSIQSFVTSGHVGNCAAVFPLQLLGYDVDVIPSCVLSNHSGYKNGAPGHRFTGDDLNRIVKGLEDNHLLGQITHILTGYVGNPSFLDALVDTVQKLRQHDSGIAFVCDPVLGDNGKLYVPAELVQIYKQRVLHHASIITPNPFELNLLTDMSVDTESEVFQACNKLHDEYGISKVFVTGTRLGNKPDVVSILTSVRANDQTIRFAVDSDVLNDTFSGSGDLITALLLAWIDRMPKDMEGACMRAMASVTGVLIRTTLSPKAEGDCSMPELRLIQSQQEILHPPIKLVRLRKIDE